MHDIHNNLINERGNINSEQFESILPNSFWNISIRSSKLIVTPPNNSKLESTLTPATRRESIVPNGFVSSDNKPKKILKIHKVLPKLTEILTISN